MCCLVSLITMSNKRCTVRRSRLEAIRLDVIRCRLEWYRSAALRAPSPTTGFICFLCIATTNAWWSSQLVYSKLSFDGRPVMPRVISTCNKYRNFTGALNSRKVGWYPKIFVLYVYTKITNSKFCRQKNYRFTVHPLVAARWNGMQHIRKCLHAMPQNEIVRVLSSYACNLM